MAGSRVATYAVDVLWGSGTDANTEAFDAVIGSVLGSPGIAVQTGRDQPRAFSPPAVPAASCDLLNENRTYSPGGVLGQFVGRGPAFNITSTYGDTSVLVDAADVFVDDSATLVSGTATVGLFSGRLNTVDHDLAIGHRVASLSALGQLTLLRNAAAITTVLYETITTSAALTVILDAAGWPVGKRAISTGQTALRYWWLNNASAFDAALQLLRSEGAGAALYEDGDGVLHFENRAYRTTTPRSITPQFTVWDTAVGKDVNVDDPATGVDSVQVYVGGGGLNSLAYTDASISANPDEVVTEATATVIARSDGALGQIWQSGTPFTLAASEVRDFYISASDPFKSAATPVISTDYTVLAGSLASAVLSQTTGQAARLRLTASGSGASVEGPTGSESNGIQVRAIPVVTRYSTTVKSTVDTSAAQARYTGGNPKTYELGLWESVSIDTAQLLVNDWATQRQAPRQQLQLTMVNADAVHLQAIHKIAVSDRLTIVNQQAVETLDVHVETISHSITTGGLHTLTLGTEVVSSIAGLVDPGTGGGGGGLPAQFGNASPGAQFGTTHSFTS